MKELCRKAIETRGKINLKEGQIFRGFSLASFIHPFTCILHT